MSGLVMGSTSPDDVTDPVDFYTEDENPQYWSYPSNTAGCSIVNGQLTKDNPPGTYTIPPQQVIKTWHDVQRR